MWVPAKWDAAGMTGLDRLRPYVPAGAVLCSARGAHDAAISGTY